MTCQPFLHLVLLVGCVVVDNGVDFFTFGNGAFDLIEKADKLLMPVPLHVLTRVSDLLCMSDLVHASKLKEHDDNDDIQRPTGRAA